LRSAGSLCGSRAISSLAALFAVNLYEHYGSAGTDDVPGWAVVSAGILAFYYVFGRMMYRGDGFADQEKANAGIPSYAATALLVVLLWKELPSAAVGPAWGFLGLALFELGAVLGLKALVRQAHIVSAAAFGRLFMANFVAAGEAFGWSHRLITVIPVAAAFFHLRSRLADAAANESVPGRSWLDAIERRFASALYSYGAAMLLVVLARFEFGRAYAVLAWAPLLLALLVLGIRLGDRHFRFQSYLLGVLLFARSWETNAYLIGDFYGIPERLATTLPSIVAFAAATILCMGNRNPCQAPVQSRIIRWLEVLDRRGHQLFSLLAALLTAILIHHQLSANLVSIAWVIEAFTLLILGMAARERSLRLYGLFLFLVCLIKIAVIDLAGVETIYRIASMIVLGLILLAASFGYTRHRRAMQRYL
jgi:hypothetical protein